MQDFWDHIKPKGAVLLSDAIGESIDGDPLAGFGGHARIFAVLRVTGCADGAAGDKLDVYLDRSADAFTWVNAAHFTQVLGNAPAKTYTAMLDIATSTPGATTTDLSADAASGVNRPTVMGDYLRARAVVTKDAATKPWTYTVTVQGQ